MSINPYSTNRVTLKQVAERAGVSVQTASHVLSGNTKVRLPDATRERVRLAATELHYKPNRHAVAIRKGKTDVIGIWMPINRPIITYLRYLQAISECANRTGHEIMIVGVDRIEGVQSEGAKPPDWPVDGILTIDAGKAAQRFRQDPSSLSTPICVLGLEEVDNGDRVSWNLLEAAKSSTKSIIDRGRTKIVHVTGDWILDGFPREQRRRGYTEAMEQAGLTPQFISVSGETSNAAQDAVASWLADGNTADGYFGFTDTYAVGAARAILKSGSRIPTDSVVWGLGDYPEAADFTVPISTIRSPLKNIIELAWTRLNERMSGLAPAENRLDLFDLEFVERESTLSAP